MNKRPLTLGAAALLGALALLLVRPVWAFDEDIAFKLAAGDGDDRIAALHDVVATGDAAAITFLEKLRDDSVKISGTRAFIVDDSGAATDPVTHQSVALPDDADDAVNNNRMRSEIEAALAALKLSSPNRDDRLAAAKALEAGDLSDSQLPLIQKALASEHDSEVGAVLLQIQSVIQLGNPDKATRLQAVKVLGDSSSPSTKEVLSSRLQQGGETDAEVRAAIATAINTIDRHMMVYDYAGRIFTGISLGSILLLAAMGLAITYGLMGIINMAHGELMMIGAYATYVVQDLFRTHFPAAFQFYPIAAVPVAFLVTACVGMVIERSVLKFLYGRSLETLLATWGVSLILMQAVRTLFGAQNVTVENPAWMSGNFAFAANLVLPYNRLIIIGFSIFVVLLVWALLNRTRLGLFVRAVTQNRTMASCIGVPTARVDTLAFGLGSGIAGLAGVALSQIGNVGPDLGQNYIVNSFMVVVLGGVGQLAGSVLAALGLGIVSKFAESITGPVIAEICVLVFVIVFIQRRPQGLFALTGRSAEG